MKQSALLTIEQNAHEMDQLCLDEVVLGLELGAIIYFPNLTFVLEPQEQGVFSEGILHGKSKNISYDHIKKQVSGANTRDERDILMIMMRRFAIHAHDLVCTTVPSYQNHLKWGRTSYRPAEIKGRKTSKRKDDTRLHVDAFTATPVQGLRILRVFCNINPHGVPRSWHVGEDFATVLARFKPQLPRYRPWQARMLHWANITKSLRSEYDHYMLHLHDGMKLDDGYQASVDKQHIDFPAQSTWMVFTDHVSHAALSGQYLLEQTFYLPVSAMHDPTQSPLEQLIGVTAI